MTLPKIEAFPSREALFDAAASVLVSALNDAVAKRGQAGFAATGGSTPAPVYDRLATLTAPWEKITVTLTDERCVPPSDPGSNEGLVRRHLLVDKAAKASFAPLYFEGASQQESADKAQEGVAKALPFGVVLLGEELSLNFVIGAVLVLLGITFVSAEQWVRRRLRKALGQY